MSNKYSEMVQILHTTSFSNMVQHINGEILLVKWSNDEIILPTFICLLLGNLFWQWLPIPLTYFITWYIRFLWVVKCWPSNSTMICSIIPVQTKNLPVSHIFSLMVALQPPYFLSTQWFSCFISMIPFLIKHLSIYSGLMWILFLYSLSINLYSFEYPSITILESDISLRKPE